MYPGAFAYLRAGSVAEATAALARYGEDARPLAGGQSLIPLMKLRLLTPTVLVDLGGIANLDYVSFDDRAASLRLGALARHRALERWASAAGIEWAALADAAGVIADVQVRNRGTVAGELAQADPGGDWSPVLAALGATVAIQGPCAARTLPVADLLQAAYTTALAPDELITEIQVPRPAAGSGSAYVAFKRRAGDYAIASVAALVQLSPAGTVADARLVVGSPAATPLPIAGVAAAVAGLPDPAAQQAAVELAAAAIDPVDDIRGSARYKRALVAALSRRALTLAHERARQSGGRPHGQPV